MNDRRAGRTTTLFDDAAFAEDLARASDAGQKVAHATRTAYEEDGVPVDVLLVCDEEGADGTRLAHCVKVYLPPPDGKFGMVFRIERRDGKLSSSTPPSASAIIRVTRTPPLSTKSPTTGFRPSTPTGRAV